MVGAVVVALLAALVLAPDDDPEPFERARSLLEDPQRFETGVEAAETLARAAQHLNDAIRNCRREAEHIARCRALSSASGYAQVLASVVLTCTAPGRFEARTRLASHLGRVDLVGAERATVPEPPPLPEC